MVFCCIQGCASRSARPEHKGVVFFLLPMINKIGDQETFERTKRRRELWLSRINRGEDFPKEKEKNNVYVCCRHFMGDPSKVTDEDHIDWAPSQHLNFDIPIETLTSSKQQKEKPSTVTKEVNPGKRKKKQPKEPKKKRLNLTKVPTRTPESTEPSSPYKIVIVKNSAITVPSEEYDEPSVTIPLQPQVIETIYLPDCRVKSEENSQFLPETDGNLGLEMWDENNDSSDVIVGQNLDEHPNDDNSLIVKQDLEETSSNDSVVEQPNVVNDDRLLTDEEKALRDFDTNITKRPVQTKCKKSKDAEQRLIKTIGYPTNSIANTNKLFDINCNTCLHCLKDHENQECKKFIQCYRCSVDNMPADTYEFHASFDHNVPEPEKELKLLTQSLNNIHIINRHVCLICNRVFYSELKDLIRHVSEVHGLCRVCGRQKKNRNHDCQALSHDKRVKKIDKIYKCQECREEFTLLLAFENHMKIVHPNKSREKPLVLVLSGNYQCPYCHYATTQILALKRHMSFHKYKTCKRCKFPFLPSMKHIINFEYRICQNCEPYDYLWIINSEKFSEYFKNIPCIFCIKVFDNGIELYSHLVRHRYCLECSLPFASVQEINEHQDQFHFSYECVICSISFSSVQGASQHFLTHHEGKIQSFIKILNNKLRTELVLSNMQCPYCLQVLGHSTKLEMHLQMVHKVNKCPMCTSFLNTDGECKNCQNAPEFIDLIEHVKLEPPQE